MYTRIRIDGDREEGRVKKILISNDFFLTPFIAITSQYLEEVTNFIAVNDWSKKL